MNPVFILTHNCLELTKKCVASVRAQDIDTCIAVIDNASTDGTREWMSSENIEIILFPENMGVSVGWNTGLTVAFMEHDNVLVLNNDTIIPPWFYSTLLSYDVPFVTGVSVGDMKDIATPPPRNELVSCPDFSAFLIRRDVFEKVGIFDETLVHYCGDLDYHIRAHRAGIRLMNAHVPFYHERSSTLNNASPRERRVIELQADADRETLKHKWGCSDSGGSYAALFDEKDFGVDVK